ncbi:MAG: hypothetical protein AB1414_15365 [bacterium]
MWWDFFATLITTISIVEMTARGYLPGWITAFMLVTFVGFRAFARAIGGIGKHGYYLFTIIFYGILVLFLALKGGWQNIAFTLMGVFYGGFEKIIAQILKLATEGYINIYFVFFVVIILVILRWVGIKFLANKLVYHSIFSIGAPIFVLSTFIITASNGNLKKAVIIGSSIMALLVMLEGIYIMFYGLSRNKR